MNTELLIIVYSTTVQEEVEAFLKEAGATAFTMIPTVHGSGEAGGTRLNTDVWPGENQMMMVSVEKEKAALIKARIKEYRTRMPREGMKLFALEPIETI